MKLTGMECPYCGASLEADAGAKTVTCRYCGKSFEVTDDIVRTEHTVNIKDEAKLKEAQLREQQYRDAQDRRKMYEADAKKQNYKHGGSGKFNLFMIVICALGLAAGISEGRILAAVIAVIQLVLLVGARMLGTGTLKDIRGVKVPGAVLTLVAALLVIPYSLVLSQKKPVRLIWPASGIAAHIPDPEASYGTVLSNSPDYFSANVERYSQSEFAAYVDRCRAMGFTEDDLLIYDFQGYDREGYTLTLDYSDSSKTMKIQATAPLNTTEISWPLNELVQELPAPPSQRGMIITDSNDMVKVLFTGISASEAQEYMNAVRETPFGENYELRSGKLTASDAEGNELVIRSEQFGRMSLEVSRYKEPEETAEPEPTPEETAEPEPDPTPEPAEEKAPAASGIRPEFQKSMDDYEAFYDQYIEFMQKYASSDNPVSMMTDYLALMSKAEEMDRSISKVDESELSDEELELYIDVTTRVTNKLAKASIDMN